MLLREGMFCIINGLDLEVWGLKFGWYNEYHFTALTSPEKNMILLVIEVLYDNNYRVEINLTLHID